MCNETEEITFCLYFEPVIAAAARISQNDNRRNLYGKT